MTTRGISCTFQARPVAGIQRWCLRRGNHSAGHRFASAPIPPGDKSALLQALLGMEQNLFVFAFTFIIVGMSWLGHHRKFSYIDKVDGRLLWLNLLYLLALCLVPFVSSVLAEHRGQSSRLHLVCRRHGTDRYTFRRLILLWIAGTLS